MQRIKPVRRKQYKRFDEWRHKYNEEFVIEMEPKYEETLRTFYTGSILIVIPNHA